MPRIHLPYPPEFRRQMVELARSGCAISELAREFECTRRLTMASARVGLSPTDHHGRRPTPSAHRHEFSRFGPNSCHGFRYRADLLPSAGGSECVSPTGGCTGESGRLVGSATGFGAPDSEATE